MIRLRYITLIALLATLLCSGVEAQTPRELTITARIDSTYVFGFDLTSSRSARGGIWHEQTGVAATPLCYSRMQCDTIDGQPVVRLYREVVPGAHPLNRWETWAWRENQWIRLDDDDC